MSGIQGLLLSSGLPYRIVLTNNSASNLSKAGIGGTATATYRLRSDGTSAATNNAGNLIDIAGEWLIGTASTSDFEVQGTWQGGGGTTGGPAGWVSLGTTRDYTLTETNNYAQQDLLLEIRSASSLAVLASATISFEVDSAP